MWAFVGFAAFVATWFDVDRRLGKSEAIGFRRDLFAFGAGSIVLGFCVSIAFPHQKEPEQAIENTIL